MSSIPTINWQYFLCSVWRAIRTLAKNKIGWRKCCDSLKAAAATLLSVCFIVAPNSVQADNNHSVGISTRVDASDTLVMEATRAWSSYLLQNSDTANRYSVRWFDCVENVECGDALLSWISDSIVQQQYLPTVISAERLSASRVELRTVWAKSLEKGGHAAVAALTTISMEKTANNWNICNPISEIAKHWKTKKYGGLAFHYSPERKLNSTLARNAARFCDSLTALFDLLDVENVKVYIASGRDELARLAGLDYYISPPHGLAYPEEKIVLNGNGSEWYPHELAHVVFRDFRSAHPMLFEGIATWVGGSGGQSWKEMAKTAAEELSRRKEITFSHVVHHPIEESLLYYVSGAALCQRAFDNLGASLVKKILNTPDDYPLLLKQVSELLGASAGEIDSEWRKMLLQYAK